MTTETHKKEQEPPTPAKDSACTKTDSTFNDMAFCLKRSRTTEFESTPQDPFNLTKKYRSCGDVSSDTRPIEKLNMDFEKLDFSKKNTKIPPTTVTSTNEINITFTSSDESSSDTIISHLSNTQLVQNSSSNETLESSGPGEYESAGSSNNPDLVLTKRTSLDELEVESVESPILLSDTDSGSGDDSNRYEEFSVPVIENTITETVVIENTTVVAVEEDIVDAEQDIDDTKEDDAVAKKDDDHGKENNSL